MQSELCVYAANEGSVQCRRGRAAQGGSLYNSKQAGYKTTRPLKSTEVGKMLPMAQDKCPNLVRNDRR